MRKQKSGKIINIASGTLFKGTPNLLHYVSSKGAIVTMTRCLSRELGDDKICVNTIAPGLTNTDMMKNNTPEKTIEDVVAKLSLKRFAEPKEIANVALFLSSKLSGYITGQVIRVDGGM